MKKNIPSGNLNSVYVLLILTTIIWGIQPLCIKWLVTEWSPVTITAMRYFFIGSILIYISSRRGEKIFPPAECFPWLILMGVTGIGLNNVMQFTGLEISTVTNCTLIAASSPAITALFAAVFIRERLTVKAWVGILISFVGALIVISHGSIQVVLNFTFNRGDILFLTAQVAWTTYSIIALRVMKKISAILTTGWAGIFGAIITTSYGLATGEFSPNILPIGLFFAFAFTVIFGGVMAMAFWNIGINRVGPSVTSIFQNIAPIVGMVGGSLFFAEIIGLPEIFGALAIFIGVYLTTHSKS